ncbi:glycosyltransferase [Delftia tsuruhatensis]
MEKKPLKKHFLLYDFMQVVGGAERVTLTLAEALPEFDTIVSRCYPEAQTLLNASRIKVHELKGGISSFLPRILESMWCFRFRSQCLRDANQVIYSGFYAPLAVYSQRGGLRIYYCHTVPRFAYDLYADEIRKLPFLLRPLYALFMWWFRGRYEAAIRRMDKILVNSENVRKRLKIYTGLDSEVLYPPVATHNFRKLSDQGYYLSTARLVPNKRVEVIVRAFMKMPGKRLVVVSGGPELERLKLLAAAAKNIVFTGWQTDEALHKWVGHAKAVIYLPVDEDFGMSPVEAMAAGKPVIGVAQGGLLETIEEGKTGFLLENPPTPDAVIAAVEKVEQVRNEEMSSACIAASERFNEANFVRRMLAKLGLNDD